MNNILEMIKNEKVEWKKLGDVCECKRGSTITKKQVKPGKVPVIAGGQEPAYYHSESNRIGETITVAGSGVNAGYVNYWNIPIFLSDAFSVHPENCILIKYLYYFLSSKQFEIYNLKKGCGIPHVYYEDLEKIEIPIPSLETQERSVKILDTMVDHFTQLEAELEAELEARNKQYEHYRYKLLSEKYLNKLTKKYNSDCSNYELKEFTLGQVIKLKNGKDWKKLNKGTIPVYGSGGPMEVYVNKFSYNKETVLIPRKGSIDNVFYLDKPFWNVDTIYYTEVDTKVLNIKYFYYFMKNIDLSSLSDNSTRPSLTQGIINNIKIIIPPIAVQEHIVSILDSFNKIVTDINEGLPKEIELRKKQYEYYRERLLDFKRDDE